ncbi:Protein-tyrosine-phosphatase mkp1 [Balamuthia mandrillaris]
MEAVQPPAAPPLSSVSSRTSASASPGGVGSSGGGDGGLLGQLQKRGALRKAETWVVDKLTGRRYKEVEGLLYYQDTEGNWVAKRGVSLPSAETAGKESHSFFIESPPHPELYEIGSGSRLFLGAQEAATNVEGLAHHKVTHILNVATGIENLFPQDFVYLSEPLYDDEQQQIERHFERCFAFIEQGISHSGVLVHCNAGVSRSASIVIAYLMNKHRLRFEEAYQRVKEAKYRLPFSSLKFFCFHSYLANAGGTTLRAHTEGATSSPILPSGGSCCNTSGSCSAAVMMARPRMADLTCRSRSGGCG